MANETLETIRKAEIASEERMKQALRDAEEVIRQAESDNVLKLQKAGQDMRSFLRQSAAEYEVQAKAILHTAEKKAEDEAATLENKAIAGIREAAAVVIAEILGKNL